MQQIIAVALIIASTSVLLCIAINLDKLALLPIAMTQTMLKASNDPLTIIALVPNRWAGSGLTASNSCPDSGVASATYVRVFESFELERMVYSMREGRWIGYVPHEN